MPYIQISSKAYTAIKLASASGRPHDPQHPSHELPNGLVEIWLSESTIDRLIQHCRDGESISDTICRAVTKAGRNLFSLNN